MKKIFTFLFAALMSVGMFGATVTEDISMNVSDWNWGKNCNVTAVGNVLQGYITSEYGYMAIGWNPTIDLSSWDKLVVEVANTNGCGGEHYLIKAFLRDLVNKDVENGQMEAAIGPYEDEGRPYTLEINLKEEGKNVNLTACGVIGIQVQPNGAIFQISRVYLEKEVEDVTTYTLQLVSSDPAMGSVEVTNLLGSGIIDNGNGTYTVPDMAEVVIQATANPTYEFAGWREGNIGELNCYYCGTAINTQENPYRFVMMGDKAIMAVFEAVTPQPVVNLKAIEFQVPASWENDTTYITDEDFPGFVATTYDIAKTLSVPSDIMIIFVYDFPGNDESSLFMKYGGEVIEESTTANYARGAFFNIAESVHFYYPVLDEPAPTTYTLQLVADPEKGSVAVTNLLGSDIIDNGNGNYTVPANAEVTILATPLEGYEFSGWKVGNRWCDFTDCGTALNTNDNPYTFTMTKDVAYKAEFEEAQGIENIVLTEKAKKVIVDGMIYIVRDGKLFNLTGAQVR